MSSLEQLITAFPKHVWFEIDPQFREEAWQQVQDYSNDVARWNAYVNYVCLQTMTNWLQEETEFSEEPLLVCPERQALPSIWEFVNGSALELGGTRLVLIPSEIDEIEEFTVPWEWVDIPGWAGDYYLAVQMNLTEEDGWLRIWGFTTHQKLKEGRKDEVRRTYSLPRQELTESLNVLWVAREVCPEEKPVVSPLLSLTSAEAEKLLVEVGGQTLYSPRLELPFEQWGALLLDGRLRQELYERRLASVDTIAEAKSQVINLDQWLQKAVDTVEQGWQTIEEIISALGGQPGLNLAYSSSRSSLRQKSSSIPKAVPGVIEVLKTSRDQETLFAALELLGQIGQGHSEAIAVLSQMLQVTQDDDLRRQVAVTLGKVDPHHPAGGVRLGKVIDLGIRLSGNQVVLVVTLIPEAEGKTYVHLRLCSSTKEPLPADLHFMILDEDSEVFWQENSNNATDVLQYAFRGTKGDLFQVKVALEEHSVTEEFVV